VVKPRLDLVVGALPHNCDSLSDHRWIGQNYSRLDDLLEGLIGQKLDDSKSSAAETQDAGQTLVSVAGPGAVETQ
jgi:hypothetical protein